MTKREKTDLSEREILNYSERTGVKMTDLYSAISLLNFALNEKSCLVVDLRRWIEELASKVQSLEASLTASEASLKASKEALSMAAEEIYCWREFSQLKQGSRPPTQRKMQAAEEGKTSFILEHKAFPLLPPNKVMTEIEDKNKSLRRKLIESSSVIKSLAMKYKASKNELKSMREKHDDVLETSLVLIESFETLQLHVAEQERMSFEDEEAKIQRTRALQEHHRISKAKCDRECARLKISTDQKITALNTKLFGKTIQANNLDKQVAVRFTKQ